MAMGLKERLWFLKRQYLWLRETAKRELGDDFEKAATVFTCGRRIPVTACAIRDAERPDVRSHAERGNDRTSH
jgi:hypothetical protein